MISNSVGIYLEDKTFKPLSSLRKLRFAVFLMNLDFLDGKKRVAAFPVKPDLLN